MVESSDYDALFKIVLVGDSNAGKSTLMYRFIDPQHTSDVYTATIGVQFKVITIPLHSGRHVKLQLWDTAGQERYRAISSAYYRGARSVIFVFDLTSRASFDNIRGWYDEVLQHLPDISSTALKLDNAYETDLESEILYERERLEAPVLHLVGNKSDLHEERTITYQEASALAESLGLTYCETSAKYGTGVYDTFLQLAATLDKRGLALSTMTDTNEKMLLSRSSLIDLSFPEDGDQESGSKKKECAC